MSQENYQFVEITNKARYIKPNTAITFERNIDSRNQGYEYETNNWQSDDAEQIGIKTYLFEDEDLYLLIGYFGDIYCIHLLPKQIGYDKESWYSRLYQLSADVYNDLLYKEDDIKLSDPEINAINEWNQTFNDTVKMCIALNGDKDKIRKIKEKFRYSAWY